MGVRGCGPNSAKMCILVDYPRTSALSAGLPLGDWEFNLLNEKLRKAGISPTDVRFECLMNSPRDSREEALEKFIERAADLPNCTTILTLGELSLNTTTEKSQLEKWHCSPLDAISRLAVRKVMPTFHPERIMREWGMGIWVEIALHKCAKYIDEKVWARKPYNFELNPPLEQTLHILRTLKDKPYLSVDIETGRGQINTMGFAWSPTEAIAINVLPDRLSPESFHHLWIEIADILESPIPKIMQNGIYETMYLAMYGIIIENYAHDTMWCQKFLWPELDKGLDAVGRIYTMEPYWKDDGKVGSIEGKKKDWGNIRDWSAHYIYNCKDTTGTLEAYLGQLRDLEARGLSAAWTNIVSRFAEPLSEMCMRGLPVCEPRRKEAHERIEYEIGQLSSGLTGHINPRSPKQKLDLLKSKGYKIPKVRDAKTKAFRESTNELSLKKLRLKYPEDKDIQALLELSHKMKALSSYIDFTYDEDGSVRFMLDGHGTETGRFSSSQDHRGRGFNVQTLPSYAKKLIEWTEESNRIFVACDLRQAESRFVAYDSADIDLIRMLEDSTKDIHRYVAAEIFQKPESEITKGERQLGKKSGHGANYAMKENTFMESCLKEMDLVLTKKEAKNVLESYHRLFPGIRRWHSELRSIVQTTRRLSTPFGRERYFYGRMGEDLFREAYAYRPQSTVPDITNKLMLALYDARAKGELDFWFHAQVHDSVLVSCLHGELGKIAAFMLNTKQWHPEINLRAGRLVIPTEVEWGRNLGETEIFSIEGAQ